MKAFKGRTSIDWIHVSTPELMNTAHRFMLRQATRHSKQRQDIIDAIHVELGRRLRNELRGRKRETRVLIDATTLPLPDWLREGS